MNSSNSLTDLLAKARRRVLALLVLDRSALAATIGMGGLVLLLLAGTQVFAWFWIALLTAASLGAGLYTLRQRIPSTYSTAQLLDKRLHLADTLSTATYFSTAEAQGDPAIRERQHAAAEEMARTVDLRAGIPYIRPKFGWWAVALCAAAFGLVATRYIVIGSLNLQPSLVGIAFDSFFSSKELSKTELAKNPRRHGPPAFGPIRASDDPEPMNDPMEAKLEATDNLETNMTPKADAGNDPGMQGESPSTDTGEKSPGKESGEEKQGDSKQDQSKSGGQKSNRTGNDSSSLMDKLKDALQGVVSKLKSDPSKSEQEQAKQGDKGEPSDQSDRKKDKNQPKGQSSDNTKSQEPQDDQSDGGKSKTAQAKSPAGDKNGQSDAQNGAGAEDGEKAVERAAQEAAMGKLTELFGKRAQNVSGEMLVEVGDTKQQIKTPYMQRKVTHADSGGEINRDEIPLMYQQFVTEYFDQVRKTAAPAADKTEAKP